MKPGSPRRLPSEPRYEIGVERRSPKAPAPRNLVAELKALGERGGSVLGAAYAWAASSVLNRVERIEDLNAERRLARRSKAQPARSAPARDVESPPKKSQPAR